MVSTLPEVKVLAEAALSERLPVSDVEPRTGNRVVAASTARLHQAEELVNLAGGRREPLEQLRSDYLELLHRASDDFAVSEALRVVEDALRLIPRPAGIYAWQRRWSTPK
jgi:hypothetical protein